MTAHGWLQYAIFLGLLTVLTLPCGGYIARAFEGRVALERVLGPLERGLLRALAVDPDEQQDWRAYARSLLLFSGICLLVLYALLRLPGVLVPDPRHLGAMPWDVSLNTAVSFVTNTSWQFYGGETTLSVAEQAVGIVVHSFLSAAVGLAGAMAVIRGVMHRETTTLGNFWRDLVRGILYVLLPACVLTTIVFVACGTVQSLHSSTPLGDGILPLFAAAGQVAIKTMGSVGGGVYNVNSAMPLENPDGISNVLQALLIILPPAALTATYGRMVGNRRQGWALFATMALLLTVAFGTVYASESAGTPAQAAAGVHGPNLEGKEVRFGTAGTALYSVATTGGSSGAVDGAMESQTGGGALATLSLMLTGEVVFGGIGVGLTSMLLLVVISVFLAGLMVGRTPDLLGKRLQPSEIKLATLGILAAPVTIVTLSALAVATPWAQSSITADGPQGFTQVFWAFSSQTMNNGSAFAGFTGFVQPHPPGNAGAHGLAFANIGGSVAMLLGRYLPLIIAIALAGRLSGRPALRPHRGTLRTDSPTFVWLLAGVIVVVALLTFAPPLLLAPAADALGSVRQ
jgi:potassium-transporting ATPase potassium-binding subunit